MTDRIAIIRIRGIRSVKPNIRKTFELLRLEKPNHCVVMERSPQTMGMLNIVKDYVTFGNISDATFSSLDEKRGRKAPAPAKAGESKGAKQGAKAAKASPMPLAEAGKARLPVYRLHPPKGGMKDIKLPWPSGVLGAREDMDAFIRKMI